MNIAILGSAGQIGAYLEDYLKEKGHDVIGVDIVEGSQNDLRVTPNIYVEGIIKNADFVFFLAFDVGGSQYAYPEVFKQACNFEPKIVHLAKNNSEYHI